jgi:hypothetical protein
MNIKFQKMMKEVLLVRRHRLHFGGQIHIIPRSEKQDLPVAWYFR